MARPRAPQPPILLRSARLLDVTRGEYIAPGELLVDGERIVDVAPTSVPDDTVVVELGDLTLLPGLMDMEVNLLLGGPDHASPLNAVQDDPALRTLRAVANARRTLRSGFTTVRNLGLFIQTGGLLLDVALMKAIDFGWIDGPRVVPAGHAICPTGGHLDPTMFQALAPHLMPLTVEEGIANGVSEVRKAVRYQIKYGAQAHQGLRVGRGDVAHRSGGRAAVLQRGARGDRRRGASRRAQGRRARARRRRIRAAIEAGIDCIEHGSLATDETLDLMVERGTFLVATTYLADGMDVVARGARAAGEGGRGVPARGRRSARRSSMGVEGRVRYRRARDPARPQRQGADRARRPRHDAVAGDPRRDDGVGGADRRRRPRPSRTGSARRRHRCAR